MNENVKEKKQKLATCYHCSSRGLMYIVGDATSNWNDYDEDDAVVYWREKQWIMLQCPSCENVSVYTEYQAFDTPLDIEYVYPQNTFEGFYSKNRLSSYHVPEKIRSSFESAMKVKHIDSQLCLVSMRKTIELILTTSNVDKMMEYLYKIIEYLYIMPKQISSLKSQIKHKQPT